mmetsp:Transcript_89203/g.109160  ORF Transcript_89203/g.109160 Transcript_89203/m.109160 type:complete len:157 (+) Transcript_89203:124-594(+)
MIIELIVFMVKVKEIYRVADTETSTLIVDVSTKIINLALISLLLTLLHFITTIWFIIAQTKTVQYIDGFSTIIDVFGNYICIQLCFKTHKKLYNKTCKCTHILCKNGWQLYVKTFHKKNIANVTVIDTRTTRMSVTEIQSVKTKSDQTHTLTHESV